MNHLEQRWQQELRALEHDIDPATAHRLAAARRRAMEQAGLPRRPRGLSPWLRPRRLIPATGAALACVLSLWVMTPQQQLPGHALPGGEPTELYEHLDFYAWLAHSQWSGERR